MTRSEDRKKIKQKGLRRRRKGSKSFGFVQKLDIKNSKKLLHRLESSNITYHEEDNLQTLTWMRKTSQPIHDGAHRKPGEIDEAGTSGATAQIVSWEVSKEFGSKVGTKCNRKKVKMIASDEKTEKELERVR